MAFHPREGWIGNGRRVVSRREFLWRAAAAGIGFPTAAAILAACGGEEGGGVGDGGGGELAIGRPESPATQPIYDDNPPIESGLDAEPGPLRIYNWADYLWVRVLKDFTTEFGVEVELTTFFNEEEALRKLGESSVDVYFPTSENISKIVAGKLVQPLNHDYIPNLQANVWPLLADPFYDKGSHYTVPYAVYKTGIGYRTDMVDETLLSEGPTPWDVFWNPAVKDIAGLYDDVSEAIQSTMFRNGVEVHPADASPEEIAAASDALVELADLVNIRYTIDGPYAGLPEGRFGVHQALSGDMVATPYYFPKGDDPSVARYLWPPDATAKPAKGLIANDTMVVVKGAEHPVLAHMFLNYMLDEAVTLKNFSWVGYQQPQNGVTSDTLVADGYVPEWLESAIVRPEDFEHELGVIPVSLEPDKEVLWLDAWARAQAGG
jgi:spermidine/putrescine transport system substrate-binding protein